MTLEKPTVSVVVPTFNESKNIPILIDKIHNALAQYEHEIVVVDDDSPDLTWKIAQEISERDNSIFVVRRTDARGLSSAILTGMQNARGEVIAVIDADMQHDERILANMADEILNNNMEVCVGSREAEGGGYGEWSKQRKIVSLGAKFLASSVLSNNVGDPMSGFFAMSRDFFVDNAGDINPRGFKILLEFLVRGKPKKVKEIGYVFRNREHGETKLTKSVILDYLLALVDLRFGLIVPTQFIKFAIVGIIGFFISISSFSVAMLLSNNETLSSVIGVEAAILWSFTGNNFFTFRAYRYRGLSYLKGLSFYQVISLHGLIIQVSVVHLLTSYSFLKGFGFAGLLLAYSIAVLTAAISNYFLHTNFTWSRLGYAFIGVKRS